MRRRIWTPCFNSVFYSSLPPRAPCERPHRLRPKYPFWFYSQSHKKDDAPDGHASLPIPSRHLFSSTRCDQMVSDRPFNRLLNKKVQFSLFQIGVSLHEKGFVVENFFSEGSSRYLPSLILVFHFNADRKFNCFWSHFQNVMSDELSHDPDHLTLEI